MLTIVAQGIAQRQIRLSSAAMVETTIPVLRCSKPTITSRA
ncbi:MAG: hypothetical protein U5K56_05160 [Halioglobus sp.]|nr:hypothetical protein [Halioglobus sp.]